MGSGARAERMAFGATQGEAKAFQEHQLAMMPIMEKQAEIEFEIGQKQFSQKLEQEIKVSEAAFDLEIKRAKAMNLLAGQLQPEPVFLPAQVIEDQPVTSKYLIYAVLGFLAYTFFLRK